MYLDKFILPNEDEEYRIAQKRRIKNSGFLDNGYPCMLLTEKEFSEIDFEAITIFYDTNGSGKSTLLNIIANKLQLKRNTPV